MFSRLKSMSANYIMVFIVAIVAVLLLFCGLNMQGAVQKDLGKGYVATDSRGNKLVFQKKPQRIASFAVSTDEMLLELVGAERLIAVSPWSDSPAVSCIADKIKNIPYRCKSQNLEAVLALQADLVVMPDYVNEEVVRTLQEAGVKVYICRTPSKIADIQSALLNLGIAVGEEERAKQVVATMNTRLQVIKNKVAQKTEAKRLRVLRIQENGSYYAPDSSFREICQLAGVKDATEDLHYERACTLSQEEIIALNPDVFIIEDWNYDGKHSPEELKKSILKNGAYATTNAGRNKKAILMPANHLLTVSQYMVDAVEDMAKALP